MALDKCAKCGKELHEFTTGRKTVGEHLYCRACYYEIAGRVFEEHPIASPKRKSATAA
jgi:DNA-directed RNA polymerase subunit RPC12/RpoP